MAEIEIDGVRFRVRVDHDMCMGNRVCEAHLAQVFTVDDDTNLSTARDGALESSLANAVQEAVADCPQDAIILERVD
jgi:ferredoxin